MTVLSVKARGVRNNLRNERKPPFISTNIAGTARLVITERRQSSLVKFRRFIVPSEMYIALT